MNMHDVQIRLDDIAAQAKAGDDERAHSMADKLWRDVLEAIATNDTFPGPATIAKMALKVDELDFARWCA